MPKKKPQFPLFPHVRNAFGMDISRQEFLQITGLSDMEKVHHVPIIVQGCWSNNWVPGWEFEQENKDNDPGHDHA